MSFSRLSPLPVLLFVCIKSYAINFTNWDHQHSQEWQHIAKTCAGKKQSPINIQTTDLKHIDVQLLPVRFINDGVNIKAYDNGHSLGFRFKPSGTWLEIGESSYQLINMHFHSHSEHTLDNRHYPIELHLLLSDDGKRVARVLAVLVEKGEFHQAIGRLLTYSHSPQTVDMSTSELNSLLPRQQACYQYTGSLTTPPCSEGIEWLVFQQSIKLSQEQIRIINGFHQNNFRPLQQRLGRPIKFSH